MATSVYVPCATCFLPDELSLDFSTEVETLPIAVDDALKADELSASAGVHSSMLVSAASAVVRCQKWCIGCKWESDWILWSDRSIVTAKRTPVPVTARGLKQGYDALRGDATLSRNLSEQL